MKEYTTIDRVKEKWPSGPWDNEPDKVSWVDQNTKLDCLAVRHPQSGHWCGYVGVSEGHPDFGKDYMDVDYNAHGGLTFAGPCDPAEPVETGVCHISETPVWWFGFDCAHSGDSSPSTQRFRVDYPGDMYRSLAYVRVECSLLAGQLV